MMRRRPAVTLTLAPEVLEAIRRRAREERLSLSVVVERIVTGIERPVEGGQPMRVDRWDVWYFNARGHVEPGFDPCIPLPDRVRAPYAIARSLITGEYAWWSGGRWHDQRPDGWPERATLSPSAAGR